VSPCHLRLHCEVLNANSHKIVLYAACTYGCPIIADLCCCAGFGCVCTVATCAWPFFKQAAIMNMMYPLFILVACKSDPLKAYKEGKIHMLQGSFSA